VGVPNAATIGLPWPWILKRHWIIGDRFFFFSVSPLTFAIGGECLRDGLCIYLGPINVGWASISAFNAKAAEEDARFEAAVASAIEARSDATGTGAAEGESAGPKDDAHA
jgi:hypothetical protein